MPEVYLKYKVLIMPEYESILRKGKKRNFGRDLTIYLCREITGETGVAWAGSIGIERKPPKKINKIIISDRFVN